MINSNLLYTTISIGRNKTNGTGGDKAHNHAAGYFLIFMLLAAFFLFSSKPLTGGTFVGRHQSPSSPRPSAPQPPPPKHVTCSCSRPPARTSRGPK